MDQDAADLYERLRITLERADRGSVKIADEIEYVLTEGYAYALNLELRPQRIEKRIENTRIMIAVRFFTLPNRTFRIEGRPT